MDIWFGDDETAELCSRADRLRARWGAAEGMAVGRRLLQIEAAPSVEALQELPGGLRRDPADGTWMIDIKGVATIKFELENGTADGRHAVRVIAVSDQPVGRNRR
jgi:hypothetical protein